MGIAIHLGERECSVQRPPPEGGGGSTFALVDAVMRARMGEVAVRVGKAAGLRERGHGRIPADDQRNFFFLEMNTRLQVEHPVHRVGLRSRSGCNCRSA